MAFFVLLLLLLLFVLFLPLHIVVPEPSFIPNYFFFFPETIINLKRKEAKKHFKNRLRWARINTSTTLIQNRAKICTHSYESTCVCMCIKLMTIRCFFCIDYVHKTFKQNKTAANGC